MVNAQFEKLSPLQRVEIGKMQTAQTVRINVKEDVFSVLSVSVGACLNSCECLDGEVRYVGRSNVKVLYDGEGGISGANYNSDFSDSLSFVGITTDSQVKLGVEVVDYKTEFSQNVITVQILLEVHGETFVRSENQALVGGEDVFCKKTDVEYLQKAKVLNLACDLESKLQSSKSISRILLADGSVCIGEFSVDNEVLTVSGKATVWLTYLSEDTLVSDKLFFEFSRQVEARGVSPTSQTELNWQVKNTRIRLDIVEGEINDTFNAELAVGLQLTELAVEKTALAVDAYCKGELYLEKDQVFTTIPCGEVVTTKTVEQSVSWQAQTPEVGFCDAKVTVVSCKTSEGEITVEGVVSANYLHGEKIVGEKIEVPFSEKLAVDFAMPMCDARVSAHILDLSLSQGGELKAKICFVVQGARQIRYGVISFVEMKQTESETSAIEVCLGQKGETLWDLAKSLHLSQEDILALNPELGDVLEQDTKVVIYNKL